jgi:hypothetical protein
MKATMTAKDAKEKLATENTESTDKTIHGHETHEGTSD